MPQPGPEDLPKTFTVTLAAREWAALVKLRDTTFPGQPLELLIRKLTQDGLIACGVLNVPKGNRAQPEPKAATTEREEG